MTRRDIVVIGASAGGLQALSALTSRLPPSLRACVLVVIHGSSNGSSLLPEIIARSTTLPVAYAKHGQRLERGRVFVAPPDRHLVVKKRRLALVHGPRENGFRPAIDPLFRTAGR